MRRFAVVTAALALFLPGVDAAAAATTTVEGTYSGATTPLARPGFPPTDCIDFFGTGEFTGNECLFEGTGLMTGSDQNNDAWDGAYQAHLRWSPAPVGECAPISGEIWVLPGSTDPVNPLPGGRLNVTVDPAASEACTVAMGFFTSTITTHIEGTIEGIGIAFEGITGTFERDGTLTFNQVIPGTDEGTFSLSYGVPDPLPTSADQCKKGGWRDFPAFNNQGDCVSFLATHGKNEPGKNLP
jgi:hypothetical protein